MSNADDAARRAERAAGDAPDTAASAPGRHNLQRNAVRRAPLHAVPDLHIGEGRGHYVPDLLSDRQYTVDPDAFAAAAEYARHLHAAEGLLHDARNLVSLLRQSLEVASDAQAMQAESALKVIERKLGKALARVNRHDARHTNLFLAYVDLKAQAGDSRA